MYVLDADDTSTAPIQLSLTYHLRRRRQASRQAGRLAGRQAATRRAATARMKSSLRACTRANVCRTRTHSLTHTFTHTLVHPVGCLCSRLRLVHVHFCTIRRCTQILCVHTNVSFNIFFFSFVCPFVSCVCRDHTLTRTATSILLGGSIVRRVAPFAKFTRFAA